MANGTLPGGVTGEPSNLPTQSFNTIVQNIAAGIQGRAARLLNFAVGSTLRAIAEAYAAVFLWFQALVLQLLTAIRLSTATGLDVDTFTADFMPILPNSQTAVLPGGSPRLGAQYSSGQVTFSRFTAAPTSILIPAYTGPYGVALTGSGVQVQTFDNKQTFGVIADPTFSTFDPVQNGYVLPALESSIIVPVQNLVAGLAGNIVAGAISRVTGGGATAGLDQVTNLAAFTNGADRESDAALKKRFSDYILGLSRGDLFGVVSAIEGIDVTVQFKIVEGYNYDGSVRPGYFFVVADDGSGNPSPQFLQSVLDAVNGVRPLGIQCAVFSVVIIFATVEMQIVTAPGFIKNDVIAQVAATIANNINALGLGNDLPFSILASWAYSVPGVAKVPNGATLLNGTQNDISTSVITQDGANIMPLFTVKALSMVIS